MKKIIGIMLILKIVGIQAQQQESLVSQAKQWGSSVLATGRGFVSSAVDRAQGVISRLRGSASSATTVEKIQSTLDKVFEMLDDKGLMTEQGEKAFVDAVSSLDNPQDSDALYVKNVLYMKNILNIQSIKNLARITNEGRDFNSIAMLLQSHYKVEVRKILGREFKGNRLATLGRLTGGLTPTIRLIIKNVLAEYENREDVQEVVRKFQTDYLKDEGEQPRGVGVDSRDSISSTVEPGRKPKRRARQPRVKSGDTTITGEEDVSLGNLFEEKPQPDVSITSTLAVAPIKQSLPEELYRIVKPPRNQTELIELFDALMESEFAKGTKILDHQKMTQGGINGIDDEVKVLYFAMRITMQNKTTIDSDIDELALSMKSCDLFRKYPLLWFDVAKRCTDALQTTTNEKLGKMKQVLLDSLSEKTEKYSVLEKVEEGWFTSLRKRYTSWVRTKRLKKKYTKNQKDKDAYKDAIAFTDDLLKLQSENKPVDVEAMCTEIGVILRNCSGEDLTQNDLNTLVHKLAGIKGINGNIISREIISKLSDDMMKHAFLQAMDDMIKLEEKENIRIDAVRNYVDVVAQLKEEQEQKGTEKGDRQPSSKQRSTDTSLDSDQQKNDREQAIKAARRKISRVSIDQTEHKKEMEERSRLGIQGTEEEPIEAHGR